MPSDKLRKQGLIEKNLSRREICSEKKANSRVIIPIFTNPQPSHSC